MLTLVSADRDYIVSTDEDGNEIVTTPGPITQTLVYWDDFDVIEAWRAALQDHRDNPPAQWSYRPDQTAFELKVRQAVVEFDEAGIVWCVACNDPTKRDESHEVNGGDDHACDSCYADSYRSCDDCGNVVHYEDTCYTLADESVCEQCRDSNYTYCEDCDGYYHDSHSDNHDHRGGCDCESPAQTFTMRNDNGEPIAQDERVTISLPSGVISEEGMHSIARLIRNHYYNVADLEDGERNKWWSLSYEVAKMNAHWQTKEGNFTKRLSKLAHKSQGLKITPDLLTKVGNIARDNSNGADVALEFTRDLNQSAEDFYHEDSCWWQSYYEGRCSLKSNGGIGMRTFSGKYDAVSGRAWIMPLRADEEGNLTATFDTVTPDAYMVFNGYGDLSGYTPARIMAQLAGMTYRKVGFDNPPMYVNGNTGYLVASEDICTKYNNGRVNLYTDTHSRLFHNEQAAKQTADLIAAA